MFDASNNKIRFIPKDFFKYTPIIKYISFAQNPLKEIHSKVLKPLDLVQSKSIFALQ